MRGKKLTELGVFGLSPRAGESQKRGQPQTCSGGIWALLLRTKTFSRLSGPPPQRLLAPSPIDLGGNPGNWTPYQASNTPTLGRLVFPVDCAVEPPTRWRQGG